LVREELVFDFEQRTGKGSGEVGDHTQSRSP
jgi:hypothetical protein